MFIQANLTRFLVYGALILLVLSFAWFHGYTRGEKKLYDYRAKQATEAVHFITKQGAVSERTVVKYIRVREAAAPIVRIIERQVHAESTANNPSDHATHCLSPAWARLHDAAATRTIPDTTSGTDAASQAPAAATAIIVPPNAYTALTTIVENYAEHHACVDKLDALQEWVRSQGEQ